MNPALREASKDGGLVIHGNPVFNAPVFIGSNYNCDRMPEPSKTAEHQAVVEQVTDMFDLMVLKTSAVEYRKHMNEENAYPIKTHPKGRVLIINNEFKNKRNERKGSSMDLMNMTQLWEQMDCAVEVEKNLTGDEIKNSVGELVNSKKASKTDFCVVIVMSHGCEGDFIVGEKQTRASVQELVQVMKDSEALRGKPKLLFFQMCRGRKAEKHQIDADGIETTDSSWFLSMLQDFLPRGKMIEAESAQLGTAVPILQADGIESDATAFEHIDGSNDIMIAFATQPDHVSFRGSEGSWFIGAITKVFAENAKDKNLKELMRMVKEEVRKNTSYMPSRPDFDQCTSTIEAMDTFNGKELFLSPGYPENV